MDDRSCGIKRHLKHIAGRGRGTSRGDAPASDKLPRVEAPMTRAAGRANLSLPVSPPLMTRRRRKTPPLPSVAAASILQLPVLLAILHLAACEIRPQSELTSACFDFPAKNFDPKNCIKAINDGHTPYLPMDAGDNAIDFTLHDLQGKAWNLADTLSRTDSPVVMIWGMYTCPGFQGYGTTPPWDMDSYAAEHELVSERDQGTRWAMMSVSFGTEEEAGLGARGFGL